ncbi:hypothetical protein Dimus_004918, partial [Dionaea muscipula]
MHHLSLPTPIIATGPPLPAITTSTCNPSLPITIATHARKERVGTRQAPPTSCCQHHRSPPEKEESTSHLCLHGSPPRQEEIDVVMDPKRVRVFLAVFLILEQRFFTIKPYLNTSTFLFFPPSPSSSRYSPWKSPDHLLPHPIDHHHHSRHQGTAHHHREPPHLLAHHPPSADSTTTFVDVNTPPYCSNSRRQGQHQPPLPASSTTEEDEGNVGLPSPITADANHHPYHHRSPLPIADHPTTTTADADNHREDSMHHLSLPTPIIATGPPLPAITTSTCNPSLPITIATHARKERAGTRQAPPTSCCQHHRSPPEKEESTSHLCLHGSPPRQEEIDVVMDPKRVRVFLAVFLILEQRFFTIK